MSFRRARGGLEFCAKQCLRLRITAKGVAEPCAGMHVCRQPTPCVLASSHVCIWLSVLLQLPSLWMLLHYAIMDIAEQKHKMRSNCEYVSVCQSNIQIRPGFEFQQQAELQALPVTLSPPPALLGRCILHSGICGGAWLSSTGFHSSSWQLQHVALHMLCNDVQTQIISVHRRLTLFAHSFSVCKILGLPVLATSHEHRHVTA